ncbi:glycosyl transferase [Amylibacter marinus]|uniref:Peptide O-xylosyltransferase n=1 Tax=Amylibacter marinus TaxID=1475483 RepID=A0ABQ5VWN1_9RHOB|nr:beta-1,6-N-acetylglucosaminyltransferase [Amylibacter marinus]GLQ35503.1 glycosyl transferase [Amylibacter marinus]
MTIGFVILAHQDLHRAEALAKYLAENSCPVAIHVDLRAGSAQFRLLENALQDIENINFVPRRRCDWGRFSLVQATLDASKILLDGYPDINHVVLTSGSCLPAKPVSQLKSFLSQKSDVDFIESVSLESEQWVQDGLNKERFTLYFPFSWKKHRKLFDLGVKIQRRLGVRRRLPFGLIPFLGSQWWCLSRRTLLRIVNDPRRRHFDKFFRATWIPDEAYFQSLARLHSIRMESRSLTWVKFDKSGKPCILYDDHLEPILDSEHFMVRKVWAGADKLYTELLSHNRTEHSTGKGDSRILSQPFKRAKQVQAPGLIGNLNAGRYPTRRLDRPDITGQNYTVIAGGKHLFPNLKSWLNNLPDGHCHGNLFGRDRVEFPDDDPFYFGNLTRSRALRNYASHGFLRNVIWNGRGYNPSIFFDVGDMLRGGDRILGDPNATVVFLKEAWLVNYHNLVRSGGNLTYTAKFLAAAERRHYSSLFWESTRANVLEFELLDVIQSPTEYLRTLSILTSSSEGQPLIDMPEMIDLSRFNSTVRGLRNEGFKLNTDVIPKPAVGKPASATPKLVEK